MRARILMTAAAALLLVTAGCFTRDEKIIIRPDGSAVVTYEMKGTAAEWAAGPAVPGALGWELVSESVDEGSEAAETTRAWRTELADLNAYPGGFAGPDDSRAGLLPEFRTRLEIRRQPQRTIYTFTRTYVGRRAGKFAELRGMGDDATRLAELEERAGRDGLESLSDEERDDLFAGLAEYEAGAMWLRTRDALGAAVLEGWLSGTDYTRVVASLESFLDERIDGDYLRRFFAADQAAQDAELDRLRAELKAEVESRLPAEHAARIRELVDREEERFRITEDLSNDHFWLEVELPGTVVGGNALLMEDGKAAWDFSGQDLAEGDRVLSAISVLEHGAPAGRGEPGR